MTQEISSPFRSHSIKFLLRSITNINNVLSLSSYTNTRAFSPRDRLERRVKESYTGVIILFILTSPCAPLVLLRYTHEYVSYFVS